MTLKTPSTLINPNRNLAEIKTKPLYQGFFQYQHLAYKHSLYLTTNPKTDPQSSLLSREVMCRGDAVVVLLYNRERQNFLLVEQVRAGAVMSEHLQSQKSSGDYSASWLLEPVAGGIAQGEDPESAVHREAMEEAGVKISNLEFILRYYPSPAACDEQILVYAAEYEPNNSVVVAGLDSEDEDIRVVYLSFTEARKTLKKHQFNVSSTIISLQWFFLEKSAFLEDSD